VTAERESEHAFLGREWLFKELYQMVIVEHTKFSLINGGHGSGKSAIVRQLVLQSPFYAQKVLIVNIEKHI
jgi:ABC-type transporter Mla maintaining outer membrane lipid asymmetry ATPase subunit MlaF